MTPDKTIITAEELFQMGDIGPCELVQGELMRLPYNGFEHGAVAAGISAVLGNFVKTRKLGVVLAGATGFVLSRNPDTVRAPDAAFVRTERIPAGGQNKFFEGSPDLAVEVLSPDDRSSEVNAKIHDWLRTGCAQVWVVDPQNQTVTVYRSRGESAVFALEDTLAADDLLPGFSLPVAEIFE